MRAVVNSRLISEKKKWEVSHILYDRRWESSELSDKVEIQLSQLCFKAPDKWSELFNKFKWKDRFDTFYYDPIFSKHKYCKRGCACQLVLVLLYRNAGI